MYVYGNIPFLEQSQFQSLQSPWTALIPTAPWPARERKMNSQRTPGLMALMSGLDLNCLWRGETMMWSTPATSVIQWAGHPAKRQSKNTYRLHQIQVRKSEERMCNMCAPILFILFAENVFSLLCMLYRTQSNVTSVRSVSTIYLWVNSTLISFLK